MHSTCTIGNLNIRDSNVFDCSACYESKEALVIYITTSPVNVAVIACIDYIRNGMALSVEDTAKGVVCLGTDRRPANIVKINVSAKCYRFTGKGITVINELSQAGKLPGCGQGKGCVGIVVPRGIPRPIPCIGRSRQ